MAESSGPPRGVAAAGMFPLGMRCVLPALQQAHTATFTE